MSRPGRWLIVNRSGPLPVYFCMEMRHNQPVVTVQAKHAHALPTHEAAVTVMAEWALAAPWKPEDHTLQPRD